MSKYTESLSTLFSEEQYRRIKKRADEGGYSSKSDYVRSMIEAGESNVAALDPRTSDTDTDTHANHDTAEAAAKALSDSALINQLDQGESNKQGFEESIQSLRQAFENTLVDRLGELSNDPSSPVQDDNRGNYYLEEDA
jgi:Arc/MetJ-type ribon-helix-helix transcriptional regulator